MCLPLAAVAVAGMVMSAASAAMQAKASHDQAAFQARTAENNAKIAGYQAQNAEQEGRIQQDKINRDMAAAIGKERAAFGAAGVSLGSGTEMEVEATTAREGATDIATTQYNTALKEWGFKMQQDTARSQAGLYSSEAGNAYTTGAVSGTASLLSSATMYQKQGIFN